MNERDLQLLRTVLLAADSRSELSFFDLLSAQGNEVELALLYGRAFFPEFVDIEGHVLLSENFDQSYFNSVRRACGSQELEETINTTYLRNVFGDREADERIWEQLGELLAQTWKCAAEAKYPNRRFQAKFSWYSDAGDPGVTLFQVRG